MSKRITCLLVLMVAAALSVSAQNSKTLEQQPLQLQMTARADRLMYRMSDRLQLEIQLLNSGTKTVYIWSADLCFNPALGLSIYLARPDGSQARGAFFLDCVPPPPKDGSATEFLKLEPGASHRSSDTFTVSDLIDRPGEYEMTVTFSSFLSRKFIREEYPQAPIAKLPIWTMDEPMLKAPTVHLKITP